MNKWPVLKINREWEGSIVMDQVIKDKVDTLWDELNIFNQDALPGKATDK